MTLKQCQRIMLSLDNAPLTQDEREAIVSRYNLRGERRLVSFFEVAWNWRQPVREGQVIRFYAEGICKLPEEDLETIAVLEEMLSWDTLETSFEELVL